MSLHIVTLAVLLLCVHLVVGDEFFPAFLKPPPYRGCCRVCPEKFMPDLDALDLFNNEPSADIADAKGMSKAAPRRRAPPASTALLELRAESLEMSQEDVQATAEARGLSQSDVTFINLLKGLLVGRKKFGTKVQAPLPITCCNVCENVYIPPTLFPASKPRPGRRLLQSHSSINNDADPSDQLDADGSRSHPHSTRVPSPAPTISGRVNRTGHREQFHVASISPHVRDNNNRNNSSSNDSNSKREIDFDNGSGTVSVNNDIDLDLNNKHNSNINPANGRNSISDTNFDNGRDNNVKLTTSRRLLARERDKVGVQDQAQGEQSEHERASDANANTATDTDAASHKFPFLPVLGTKEYLPPCCTFCKRKTDSWRMPLKWRPLLPFFLYQKPPPPILLEVYHAAKDKGRSHEQILSELAHAVDNHVDDDDDDDDDDDTVQQMTGASLRAATLRRLLLQPKNTDKKHLDPRHSLVEQAAADTGQKKTRKQKNQKQKQKQKIPLLGALSNLAGKTKLPDCCARCLGGGSGRTWKERGPEEDPALNAGLFHYNQRKVWLKKLFG